MNTPRFRRPDPAQRPPTRSDEEQDDSGDAVEPDAWSQEGGEAEETGYRPRGRRDEPVRAVTPSAGWLSPWVQLKYFSYHPSVYGRMIAATSPRIEPGSLVTVYDRNGEIFGSGFHNGRARVPLRVLHHGTQPIGEDWFPEALARAVSLRRGILRLDAVTEAWRAVSSDGDSLSGLTIDRYGDVLMIEVHSLGIWQRLPGWLATLHELCGTRRHIIRMDPEIARIEGVRLPPPDPAAPKTVRVREHGIRYEVNFAEGHKTGFFCDQRDNRRRLADFTEGRRVLDICCYTGGFALSAKLTGKAAEVTAVDLDEKAIAQARHNANLNQCRGIDWVHADAFSWMRTMIRNGTKWEVIVLDPPKLVHSRDDEEDDGRRRYEDMNGLALQLLEPGGIFVTCSCSGLLGMEEFERIVIKAAHRNRRRLQFLDRTGAGADHPVLSNCPESRYLKVIWARVW
jgi:23S rRNA (cytosine1962-C5)-methyltransferase